jgi:dethiobiotin synthetase
LLQKPGARNDITFHREDGSSASSLNILGTEFGCGKTILMSGLSALLREQGFTVAAKKPVLIGSKREREAERAFISSISRTPPSISSIEIERGATLTKQQWLQAVNAGKLGTLFSLIELPAGLATPLSFDWQGASNGAYWRDSTDLAKEFGAFCLLVAKHNDDAIEKLTLSASYAQKKGLELLGLATVETSENQGRNLELIFPRDKVELSLHSVTGVPYLGCVKYSQSISVGNINQGNLVKMTGGGIELLSVLKRLNLRVPRPERS